MTTCSIKLTSDQRCALKTLLKQETILAEQCDQCMKKFAELSAELQLMHHDNAIDNDDDGYGDGDESAHRCKQFMRTHSSIDCNVNATSCDVTFKMIKIAASCDCMCLQSACFRVLHKWTPLLDRFRMKLLKIKHLCLTNMNATSAVSNAACAKIRKTVQKITRSKTTS
jgi:hypothetical protein